MNDDFIYKALPKVPQAFSQSLYARISGNSASVPQAKRRIVRGKLKPWQVALIIFSLVLVVAWVQVVVRFRYVPIGDLWLVELSHPTQSTTSPQPSIRPIPTPRQFPTLIIDGEIYYLWTVDDLSPVWIPDGFKEMPQEINSYGNDIRLWSNSAQEIIQFSGVPQAGGMHPYAPAGMYEEVRVNGNPAILIHGRLALTDPKNPTARRKWDETLGLQLSWTIKEAVYTLETFGLYLPEQDLIRMAESMKEDTLPSLWTPNAP